MGRIPEHFIDELLTRTDIVEVINQRVPLKKAGREYTACCPFHNEKSPSFTVSPTKQFYHCFGCGAHGSAIGFLMEYEHLDFVEAIETLAHDAGLEVPRESGPAPSGQPSSPKIKNQYQLLEQAASFYQNQLKKHPEAIEYLKTRGLSGEIARDYGLGYAPDEWDGLIKHLKASPEDLELAGLVIKNDSGRYYDRFRKRIMFPIRDRKGQVIAFGGRVLNDGSPKYLNSPETSTFHKGQEAYGLFEARQHTRKLERLLVVEGYMDVIALAQHDIRYAVATLGTATSSEHIQRLFRIVPEIVFCFDGDRAGRDAARKALKTALPQMQDGREAYFLFLQEGEDPDSLVRKLGKEGFEALLQQATGLTEFFIQSLTQSHNSHSQTGRTQLARAGMELIQNMQGGLLKTHLIEELGRVSHIHPHQLHNILSKPSQTTSQRQDRRQQLQVTPVRLVIHALLHQPQLASEASATQFLHELDLPGLPIIRELLENIHQNPNLSTAALLERWRGREEETHLHRLMEWSPPGGEDLDLSPLFHDAMGQLQRRHNDQRLELLLHKAEHSVLDDAEKKELRTLLTTQKSNT
jgi:DNA primase